MSNILLAGANVMDDAVVNSFTTETSGLPADNVLSEQPSKVWRTTSDASQQIIIDLASTFTGVDFAALLWTNLTTAADVRLRMGPTLVSVGAGSPQYDSGTINPITQSQIDISRRHYAGYDSAGDSNSVRYIKFEIDDAANPDGYLEIGRILISKAWQPSINMKYGASFGFNDDSKHKRSLGSRLSTLHVPPYLEGRFTLDFQSEADMMDNALQIDYDVGSRKDMVIVTDPSSTRKHSTIIHGKMMNLQPIINSRYQIFQKRYLIEEML